MPMMNRRSLMAGLAAAPLLAPGAALAQDATPLSGIDVTVPRVAPPITPYTIEELFRPAPALDADLSADGKHVALLLDVDQGGNRETQLLIFSADDPTFGEARFRLGDTNTHWIRWAGSARVLVGVSGESGDNLTNQGSGFRDFHDRRRQLPYRRILSVPVGGGPTAQLFEPAAGPNLRVPPGKFRKVLNLAEVVAVTDGEHALMAAFDKEDPVLYWRPGSGQMPGQWLRADDGPPMSSISLYSVDLATGEPELIMEGSDRTIRWEAQGGEPILRRDMDAQGENEIWRTKPLGQASWRPVRTVSRAAPDITVLAPSDTARTFWVLAKEQGEAHRSIRLWNVDTDTLADPVSGRPDREPTETLFDPDGRFLLASYRGPRGLVHETPDAGLKTSLATLAVQFGDGAGVRVMHVAPDRTKLLVEVSGPRQPRAYFLFDAARRRLADIGGAARLKPERLADAEGIAVDRSGAEPLAGVLTGSLDGKPGPLVVILQSAGDRESFYDFNPMAQLFATRGWWTLRTSPAPEADIDALTAAAVRTGSLDSSRTAILGEQDAGDAALAAIARHRAAVVFNSPSVETELLAGADITARNELALRATLGERPVLVIRNWRDSRSGRTSDARLTAVMPRSDRRGVPDRITRDSRGGRPSSSELADALRRSDTGGLADAVVLGEAGDADWNRLETRIARARAVVEFLDPILK
jgi:dipeptidyl aminopeptidase/acylaminoacyl peptidase